MTVQTFTVTDYCRMSNVKENGIVKIDGEKSAKFWKSFRINEWTFSLFLFVISLGIVAVKIYVNYGSGMKWSINAGVKNVNSMPTFSRMYNAFAVPNSQRLFNFDDEHRLKIAGERLINVSREYGDAMAGAVVGITNGYSWLLRAVISGIAMMGFTWFIIYKDSSIPGVNPPSPFSPKKSNSGSRYPEKSRLQINYLVGALNGALIFVYMCL